MRVLIGSAMKAAGGVRRATLTSAEASAHRASRLSPAPRSATSSESTAQRCSMAYAADVARSTSGAAHMASRLRLSHARE